MSPQSMHDISSAQALAAAFDALPDAVLVIDDDWRILYANTLARTVVNRPTLVGQNLWDVHPRAAADGLRDRLQRLRREGGSTTFEAYGYSRHRWLRYEASATPRGIVLIVRAVPAPGTLGTHPVETLSRFWHLFESVPEGVCVVTADRRCISVNAAMLAIVGAERPDQMLQSIDEWPRHDVRDAAGRPLPFERWPIIRALAGETVAAEMVRFGRGDSGEWRIGSAVASPVYDEHGEVVLAILTLRDVTEHEETRQALQRAVDLRHASERRFGTFMDHVPALGWMADIEGRLVYFNERFAEHFGLDRGRDFGRFVGDLLPPAEADFCVDTAAEVIRTSGVIERTLTSPRRNGVDATFLCVKFAVDHQDGSLVGGMAVDITDRTLIEQELRDARDAAESANRAKDHFLAVLSHELRTPLTPVLLFASSLERNTSLPDDVREELALIRQQVQLEARLIDDLLDLTRIQRGKMLLSLRPIHLNDTLRRVVEIMASGAGSNGLKVDLDLQADPDLVSGDTTRLHQLFSNVIGNAIKFTPAGGTIIVRSRTDAERQVVIEVVDTGIGIEPTTMPRVFNAFEQAEQSITRQYGGLGLGLTIGKAIAEMHGGEISAASPGSGAGTTIRIRLPLLTATDEPAEAEEHPPTRPTVLIVEDHEATREAMYRLIQMMGFDVIVADSVSSALRITAQHAYDVLVCDIGLPDGLGTDLLPQLRNLRQFRAIALSGYGTADDIQRSLDAGFEAHLVKPIDSVKLEGVMKSLMV